MNIQWLSSQNKRYKQYLAPDWLKYKCDYDDIKDIPIEDIKKTLEENDRIEQINIRHNKTNRRLYDEFEAIFLKEFTDTEIEVNNTKGIKAIYKNILAEIKPKFRWAMPNKPFIVDFIYQKKLITVSGNLISRIEGFLKNVKGKRCSCGNRRVYCEIEGNMIDRFCEQADVW